MTKQTTQSNYLTLSRELEIVLTALQRPDVQVDEAVKLYEQGLKLAAALETHLQQAENNIQKLKLQAPGGQTDA
jgi:exodeoxyribonuclease VII small subunit